MDLQDTRLTSPQFRKLASIVHLLKLSCGPSYHAKVIILNGVQKYDSEPFEQAVSGRMAKSLTNTTAEFWGDHLIFLANFFGRVVGNDSDWLLALKFSFLINGYQRQAEQSG